MKRSIILSLGLVIFFKLYSQNEKSSMGGHNPNDSSAVYKKFAYSNPLQSFSQSLILKRDSTFTYSYRAGLIRKEVKGEWQIFNSVLFLKSFDTSENIIIKEFVSNKVSKESIEFKVSDLKGNTLNYNLFLMDENGITKSYDTSIIVLKVPITQIKYFLISSVIRYDKYYPTNKNSNYFEILINTDKVFVNPIWLIKGNRIFVLATKNEMSDDYFMQE